MKLLASVFCIHGCDNRPRYAIILLTVYFAFFLLTLIAQQQAIFSSLTLMVATAITALTTKRRLNDAKLIKNWLHIASGLFFVVGIVIIFAQQNAFYWLLLFPAAFSSLLLTYPSKTNGHYILGYYGPVDLSEFQQQTINSHRIEPSFSQSAIDENEPYQQSTVQQPPHHFAHQPNDLGEFIREKLLVKQHAKWAILTLVTAILITIVATIYTSEAQQEIGNQQTEIAELPTAIEPPKLLYPLTFPDTFSIMMTEYSGVVLSWPGDYSEQTLIWQQLSAEGDNSCQQLIFNKNKAIRTLKVEVDENGDHFAYFSPLDSQVLIQDLAIKSNFKLCGYKFSLKGTQALLGKTSPYNNYVSY